MFFWVGFFSMSKYGYLVCKYCYVSSVISHASQVRGWHFANYMYRKKKFLEFRGGRFAVENEIKRILFLTKVQKMVHCT